MSIDPDLGFLRDEFGFRFVREDAPRPGERSTTVLESNAVRIEIEHELGVRVLHFSALEGAIEKHVDNALLNFIEHRHGLPRDDDPTSRLRRHLREIVLAFAQPRPVAWWRDFDAYRAKRLTEMRKGK